MENKGLWVGVGALCLALAALVLALRSPVSVFVAGSGAGEAQVSEQRFGGTTGLDSLLLRGSLTVEGASSFTGSLGTVNTGALSATSVSIGTSNTVVDLWKITSSTVNVDSLGSGGATSSVITVTGAALNDYVNVGLTGNWGAPSSSVAVSASVTAADQVTLYWLNTSSTAVNLTSALYNIEVVSP